jgi:hypothetical protein
MPTKDPAKRRALARDSYHRRKHLLDDEERTRQTAVKQARLHTNRVWFAELKDRFVCTRCGESHPACLQFHHEDPTTKELGLSDAIRRGWGRARILRELEKCKVLCANCHIRHHVSYARKLGEVRV